MPVEAQPTRLDARIRALHAHRDFPVVSDQVREVLQLSEDEDAAVDRLAGLVIRNYGLTLKVLRTVNSIHYNRSGQTILSVTRAVMLLGVRTVRQFCASFLVFDHYQRQSAELKELMLFSMVTACQSEALSSWVTGVSGDEAYVCGMFRNLGEVLIAHHFPEDYARIRQELASSGEAGGDVVARQLGFSYEELGEAMARYWGMPVVGQSMLPQGTSSGLRAITALSHSLTGLVYRSPTRPTDEQVRQLVTRFKREIPIPPESVAGLIAGASEEVRKQFVRLGMSHADLDVLTRSRAAPSPAEAGAKAEDGPGLQQTRDSLLREAMASGTVMGGDLRQALLIVLEALHRGGPFDRVLLCLVEAESGEIRGRFGLGEGVHGLVDGFRFPLAASNNSIAAALDAREPVIVSAADAAPRDARILKLLGTAQFAVLPLSVDGKVIGCLYCDRRTPKAADLPGLVFLGRVQSLAETTIDHSRRDQPQSSTFTA